MNGPRNWPVFALVIGPVNCSLFEMLPSLCKKNSLPACRDPGIYCFSRQVLFIFGVWYKAVVNLLVLHSQGEQWNLSIWLLELKCIFDMYIVGNSLLCVLRPPFGHFQCSLKSIFCHSRLLRTLIFDVYNGSVNFKYSMPLSKLCIALVIRKQNL